jgi:hypothetical protein
MEPGSKSEAKTSGWKFFDRVYCLSLSNRSDRYENARRQFETVGLLDRVEFIFAEKHPTDNEVGIYESHMAAIKKGLAADARHILIFEDDVVFEGFSPEKLQECVDVLGSNDHCRLLFLGCLVAKSRRTNNPGILRVNYRSLAHAYVLKHALAAELAIEKWHRVPFDGLLAGLKEDKFAVYPAFAFQSNAISDNDNHKGLEKFRRLFGGLKFIQKMNERYHRHRAAIISGHLFLIAFLLWLVVR